MKVGFTDVKLLGGSAVNKNEEVEYCNLELRFDRQHIQDLIKDLIQEGYSLYWSENEQVFVISVRTGRKLVKLRFQRIKDGYKLVGDYMIRDARLSEWMEKLIGDMRGHAIVKRFRDRQIIIENILFGEVIRLVEISGYQQRVLYQKGPMLTDEELTRLFYSIEGEERVRQRRIEVDEQLDRLNDALKAGDTVRADKCRAELAFLTKELFMLEW
jgi:molybdopterin converting factor small subunit